MASETESLEYLSHEMAERMIGEWIGTHLALLRAGHGSDDEAVQHAIDQAQYLHLSGFGTLVSRLFVALKLAGWRPPVGELRVTYDD